MHPMLNIAVKAARRAGSIINRAALDRTKLEIRSKQANDFVTQVDKAAEAAIIDIIRQAYPDHVHSALPMTRRLQLQVLSVRYSKSANTRAG